MAYILSEKGRQLANKICSDRKQYHFLFGDTPVSWAVSKEETGEPTFFCSSLNRCRLTFTPG